MSRFLLVLTVCPLTATLLVAVVGTASSTPQESSWRIEEVAPDVLAAIQPAERRFNDSNSAIVLGPEGVLLVDAQSDPASVRALQGEIDARTDRLPVALVNTHWHGDHTEGNALHRARWGRSLAILGHATLLEDVPVRTAGAIGERRGFLEAELGPARERLERGVDRQGEPMDEATLERAAAQIRDAELWIERTRELELLPPDLAYRSELVSSRIGRTVHLLHAPGHTRGDTVVWLPDERVLIAGDLVDAMPFAGHGAPARWGRSLRRIAALEPAVVVPGHGPVYRGTERIETLAAYFEEVASRAAEAVAAGLSAQEAIESIDLGPWRERLADSDAAARFFDQVQDEAIRAAWEEASGAQ